MLALQSLMLALHSRDGYVRVCDWKDFKVSRLTWSRVLARLRHEDISSGQNEILAELKNVGAELKNVGAEVTFIKETITFSAPCEPELSQAEHGQTGLQVRRRHLTDMRFASSSSTAQTEDSIHRTK